MSSVFFHFLRERSFKSRQNPRVDIFQARKVFEGFKTAFLFGRGPNRVMETACFDANVQ